MSDRVVVNTMNHRFVETSIDRIRNLVKKQRNSNDSDGLTVDRPTNKYSVTNDELYPLALLIINAVVWIAAFSLFAFY